MTDGDEAAFRRLVDAYQEKVLNTCYRFVNTRQDAEDVTQEVFLEVFRSVAQFRGDASLSTWIYRIAVSRSLDFVRKSRRKKRFGRIQRLFNDRDEPVELPDAGADSPQDVLEKKERAELLRRTVETLPENQRIAIVLNKYEGFKAKEIAEIMTLSQSSVESLIHRAKARLRKDLKRYFENAI